MSDMTACLNDLNYIPLNNEQNGDTNKDVHFCPVCKTSRWKDSNTPGKKVPKKVLRYFPIIPRLQRLYKSSHIAKEMTWHATGKCTEPDKMKHPVDGRAWKNFDTKYLDFAEEPINVQLGLAANGILNILLMNDKSKDTAKARQDLKRLGIRSGLWLSQNKNEKCSKPQAAYSFTPEDRKKFCQFIKGAKLPNGVGSNFKHKVTNNETNITGLQSHDCHIMMQRLLPYELQQYLPPDVAKPLIELCLFFKQICSQTLIVNDMLKAQSKIRQCHVDNDPGVSESSKLFTLAYGPSHSPISVNSCVVNGVRFVVHNRDELRTTQNRGICSPSPDGEMYYGQLEQILEFSYFSFKTMLFQVKWFDTSNKGCIQNFVIRKNITQIKANGEAFKNDQYILATQVKLCFYLEDMARQPLEDDPDVIHVDNSSDLSLSTRLNDLEIVALHIHVQSIYVDAPPDIIDVDKDDDIIDEEDPIPYDLADSDDEDLINLDIDDGVNVVYSSEEED
ncbi:hypothetical protein Tco_0486950 [Tanacetum coccineum]